MTESRRQHREEPPRTGVNAPNTEKLSVDLCPATARTHAALICFVLAIGLFLSGLAACGDVDETDAVADAGEDSDGGIENDDIEADDDDGDGDSALASFAEVPEEECTLGKRWVGGEEDSALMIPGGDCIGCHVERGEGPIYTAAGTVFAFRGEPTNCIGVEGAIVYITDAEGHSIEMTTNAAGNFGTMEPIAAPYTTGLRYQGEEWPMISEANDPNCATCHIADGGRRVAVP